MQKVASTASIAFRQIGFCRKNQVQKILQKLDIFLANCPMVGKCISNFSMVGKCISNRLMIGQCMSNCPRVVQSDYLGWTNSCFLTVSDFLDQWVLVVVVVPVVFKILGAPKFKFFYCCFCKGKRYKDQWWCCSALLSNKKWYSFESLHTWHVG